MKPTGHLMKKASPMWDGPQGLLQRLLLWPGLPWTGGVGNGPWPPEHVLSGRRWLWSPVNIWLERDQCVLSQCRSDASAARPQPVSKWTVSVGRLGSRGPFAGALRLYFDLLASWDAVW